MTNSNLSRGIVALVALALVAPSVASAQVGRYKRKTVAPKVKKTAATKEIKAEDKSDQEKERERVPEITADQFMQIETEVQNIRNEQITEYIALIKDTPADDPERPDLLFRLAELYAQKQRYYRFQYMEYFGKIEKAPKNKKASLKSKQKKYADAETKYLKKSIGIYKRIVENPKFRDYPRMDEAMFFYAYTLQNAKYAEPARKVFYKLIKDFPNSKYIPYAYLAFADYYFNENSLANAEKFYDKVLQFPKSPVYVFAMYKKGWVYLNLDRPQDALETFFKVAQKTERDKKNAVLNKASKKDFVRAYAKVGKPSLAYKAFQRVDKGYAFKMLQILGDLYLSQGKAGKTVYVFRELMSLKPKHPEVCNWQFTVVRATLTVGNQDEKVKEVERLVKLHNALLERKILPETEQMDCTDNAQGTTGELAKVWHNEAEKTLNTETLQYVDRLYKLYMKSFPTADDYGDMQFYYGELLWRRAESEKNPRLAVERWEAVAAQFTDVVQTNKVGKKLRKEAAYAAVLGWKNAIAFDPRKPPPPPDLDKETDKIPEPQEIPENQAKMLAAFDVYIDYIKDPTDKDLVDMKWYKARLYWRYKHYDKAIPLFQDIINKHLDHETSEFAINLLLDSYNTTKQYDEMLKWVNKIAKKTQYLSEREELADRLASIQAQSARKAAETAETDGRYLECGNRYREIFDDTVKKNPDAEGMDEVLYNAGVCFEKAKSIGLAVAMRRALIDRYPKTRLAKRAMVLLGNNYGAIAYYPEAAEKFEEYSKRFSGEKDAANAMANAVFYRRGIGQDNKAIENTEFFVKRFGKKKSQDAADALFGMTGIYEKRGDTKMVIKHLERYLKQIGKKGGVDRQIIAHAKIGKLLYEQSCDVDGVDGACIKVTRKRSIATRRKGKRRRGSTLPKQCGPESKIKTEIRSRNSKRVKEANKHFKAALKLYKGGKALNQMKTDDVSRKIQATYWAAASEFYLAEQTYEDFLRVQFPDKLDFDPKNKKALKKSQQRFNKYLEAKKKALAKTKKAYTDLMNIRGGGEHWIIAGAARVGQLYQNFSDQLFTAEIPKDVRSGKFAEDKVDAYCDALTTAADPLEEESITAFDFCLKESSKRNWFNDWSRLCEKELGQIRPLDFPTASEMHAGADNLGLVLDVPDAEKGLTN